MLGTPTSRSGLRTVRLQGKVSPHIHLDLDLDLDRDRELER